jgi:hypothetical protein
VKQSIPFSEYRSSRGKWIVRLASIPLLLAAGLTASNARAADEAAPAAGEDAVTLGRAALEAYTAGEWRRAHDKFSAAERSVHSPVFVLYMARCKRNLGALMEARELFRSVVNERLAPSAPPSWQQAVTSAHAELATLQQNIPSVWLEAASAAELERAQLDGRALPRLGDNRELELDPGRHVFEITRADGSRATVVVQLSEGRRRIPVQLSPSSRAITDRGSLRARSGPPPFRTREVVGYTALGVGAVGVTLGVITGLIAKSRRDALLRDYCDESGSCYADARPKAEAASQWAAASTASFIFGSGFLAAGTSVLLFVPSTRSSQAGITVQGAF